MKFNLNKLFPFLSIRKKLIIAFSLLSFIPLSVIGVIGIYINLTSMHNNALDNLDHDISMVNERARNFLSKVHLDIQNLNYSPILQKYIEDLSRENKNRIQQSREFVESQFLTFAKMNKIYYQIRFCNSYGDEKFLIQYQKSDYQIMPKDQLGLGSYQYYFLITNSLQNGKITFVPTELKGTNNSLIPVISFATRIYNQKGEFTGIFVMDVFAKDFFKILERDSHLDLQRKTAIISQEGYYVYHSEKKKDWNRLLAYRDSENLYEDYPIHYAKAILSGSRGIISKGYNEIAAYAPLFTAQMAWGSSYYLVESIEKKAIFGQVRQFAMIVISLFLLFLFMSILFGYLATNHFAVPIKKLQDGAKIISKGNYSHRLKIETNDEIEQLANQFNQMAIVIKEREELLEEHQKTLEEKVQGRTQELHNEKEKLQAILDNVPSAFILLDRDFKIKTTSAALRNISEYGSDDFIGKACYEVFGKEDFCTDCSSKLSLKSGKMSSVVKKRIKNDGGSQYLEHTSIPLSENGKITSLLEIVTDITERKRIEEQAIRTEKLSATGEMAAVIAHEIRNSLTSQKLILQFLKESQSIKSKEKDSINVAIASVLEMEDVVTQLLSFARPNPMKFFKLDLNQIVDDSINFVKHQLDNRNIKLELNKDNSLPLISIDPEHLRAAFVNILLNAQDASNENGNIRITTRFTKMSETISDYLAELQMEITLRKNQEVISISFEDNGSGISKKNMNLIFDPFFTSKTNGTGLGLPLAKRVILEHGGLIIVKSHVDKGTIFNIFLPYGGVA
jgi:PAS domain S-box-containing protein